MKDRGQILTAVLLALLSLLVSGWVGYGHQHEDTAVRISVLETQRKDDHDRLERIEIKVDELLRRVGR